ncbi:MAG: AAA family ATPase [Clostridiaceae bacterium]|nr:AAA family ATPase [Clostridiaceae bacterium]
MNIKRAKTEIKNTIEAYLLKDEYGEYAIPSIRQRPVLLIGPPGVGKTQIMEQIAQECQIGLVAYTITHHTRQSAIGLPMIEKKTYGGREYAVTEYTMSEIVASIYDMIERTGLQEGILFIDEINCVSETLAPTMLQFLQCKTFGNHAIPEGWMIVAAGNPPEFNKSVRDFDIVTLDRIKMIHVEADFDVWREYAYQVKIHPAVISYLGVKKQYFCQIETTVDGPVFATPRGWEDLSRLIEVYEKIKKPVDRDVVFQYIQHGKIARDFANYLELYYKYQNDYQVDEILSGVIHESACNKLAKAPFDERLSVIGLLLSRLGRQFYEIQEKEQFMELFMKYLRKFSQQPEIETGSDGAQKLFESLTGELKEKRLEKKAAKLLSRKEDRKYLSVIDKMDQCLQILRAEYIDGGKEAWERLRQIFGQESGRYEEMYAEGGQMLEYAFNFMEAAFGESQEMVIFITELNTNYYSVHFLQSYECERYYQYNKNLLFDRQEAEILDKIGN